MEYGGGNGGGSFRVKHGWDAAEVTDVHEAGAEEVGDVVGEREMRIKKITPRLRTGVVYMIRIGVLNRMKRSGLRTGVVYMIRIGVLYRMKRSGSRTEP